MSGDPTRARIVEAAMVLLVRDGRDGVTTRAVAEAAQVQAPTIYRLFGDKRGLLDAVAAHGYAMYLRDKSVREPIVDPVEDLRAGWDLHVAFGLANPAVYTLMADPALRLTAGEAGLRVLARHVRAIAAAGRLRIREARAVDLIHAAGLGTVLTLLEREPRDLALSATARDAVIQAITLDAPVRASPTPATAAIALRAVLDDAPQLSAGERALLDEWLARLAT